MATVVTIRIDGAPPVGDDHAAMAARAIAVMEQVSRCCNRFDPESELSRLTQRVGVAVAVSPILFEALRFAVAVARQSAGAFDPAVGARMIDAGFDQDYRTGAVTAAPAPAAADATWRDVIIDDEQQTVTLVRPVVLDLGAVAKGLAVDVASRVLAPCRDFVVDAGGDLFLGGHNASGEPWRVGIRHPRDPDVVVERVAVSDAAVCTSGDYERVSPLSRAGHHLLDGRTDAVATACASATVIAPTAMVADALSTTAFALGPTDGIAFLESQGVAGLLFTPALTRHATRAWP
jgi:thiamine biosynthesis lipoprotein